MKISLLAIKLIQHFEGFEPQLYRDAAGYWTIGYGHLLREGEGFRRGITHAQATQLLRQDVRMAERAVSRLIGVPLSQSRWSVSRST